ncbi:hypothetical protein OIE91_11540 [Streptomyces albidoflavus]|uniref:hypothetical protein n=1 Tax=Streptomyces albidoflavus TaxID=1886 RepID=UPI00352EEB13
MSSIKEAAAREAVLKTLLDTVRADYETARAETQELLEQISEETGTQQVVAALPDGPDIATVSLSGSGAEAKVTDREKFTAWVIQNYGTEIERRFVTEVREAFTKLLLKQMTAAGSTEWSDPETGVIHDEVPGVELVQGRSRTHSVRFKKDGRERVMQAWRDGHLAGALLPQLGAGTEDGAA